MRAAANLAVQYYLPGLGAPLPDLRSHIAHDCQGMMTTAGTDTVCDLIS